MFADRLLTRLLRDRLVINFEAEQQKILQFDCGNSISQNVFNIPNLSSVGQPNVLGLSYPLLVDFFALVGVIFNPKTSKQTSVVTTGKC